MRHARSVRAAVLALVAATTLAACDTRPGRSASADSVVVLAARLQEVERDARDRQAIAQELAQTTRLLEEIDGEVSKVRGLRAPGRRAGAPADDPWVARHESLLGKVRGVSALLAQSRARVDALSRTNRAQSRELASYRQTIGSLESLTRRQQGEIATLARTVDSLRGANGMLVAERDLERETVRGLRDTASTVYYVVGTKAELIRRGVVSEDGRKRFVLFGGRGLVPARRLDRSAFTQADMRQPLEIPLPVAGRRFHVVSRHDPSLLDVPAEANRVRVKEPGEFWGPSRYLIIVTQG